VIDALRERNGWALRLDLAYELNLTAEEIDEYLELLEQTGEIEKEEIGTETLVALPKVGTRRALAELSDIQEDAWRRERGEELPPLDERAPGGG